MNGQIDILNCGAGHSEVKIDVSDPIALARSERIIQDMLRRGYVLFITGPDNSLVRVEKFDATKHVYIIGDGPMYSGGAEESPSRSASADHGSTEPERRNPLCGEAGTTARRGPGRPRKVAREVPIDEAHVTAIARTAGG